MTPDDFQQAWNTQSSGIRVKIDTEMLDAETRRFQEQFTTRLFWRDLREVGTAVLLIPVWLYLGYRRGLPWTWYLAIPALMWVAGYMLVDRWKNRPRPEAPGDSVCQRLESLSAQIEGQIRLLKSVHWWGLLPLAISLLAFLMQVVLQAIQRHGTPNLISTIIALAPPLAIIGVIFFFVYWLNRHVVRTDLIPRRDELNKQLQSLQEESAESGAQPAE